MRRIKFIYPALTLVSFFAIIVLPSLAFATDVPKWSTQDFTFVSTNIPTNWNGYTSSITADTNTAQSLFNVTFKAPTGSGIADQTVPGFYNGLDANGHAIFDVRFTPTTYAPGNGNWSYTVSSSVPGISAFTAQQPTAFTVSATPPANNHGFLRVDSANKSSFVYDDGARYFMMGQTYYDWIGSAMQNDNWQESVLKSKAAGFTKIRFDVYMGGLNNGAQDVTLYPDKQPYAGASTTPDRNQLNFSATSFDGSTYFQKMDEMVQFMNANGMVADMIITNPYYHQRMLGTSTQNNRFVNYVVNRYAAYTNVTWCLSNEWEKTTVESYSPRYGSLVSQSDFNNMGNIVHNNDPWGQNTRPLSIHNMQKDFQFFGTSWPTHAIIQYSDSNLDDRGAYAGIYANLRHNMPVVNDEFVYIGQMTQTQHRQNIWGIAAAGGYSSTADFRSYTMGVPENTGDWYDEPEYADVRNLVDFFTTKGIEYWKMASHNELKSGSRTYLLAEPGRQYVAYKATGGTFSLTLAPGTYHAYLYNPRTGVETPWTTPIITMTTTGTQSFSTTAGSDWVIRLTTTPEPGAMILLGIGAAGLLLYRRWPMPWRRSR